MPYSWQSDNFFFFDHRAIKEKEHTYICFMRCYNHLITSLQSTSADLSIVGLLEHSGIYQRNATHHLQPPQRCTNKETLHMLFLWGSSNSLSTVGRYFCIVLSTGRFGHDDFPNLWWWFNKKTTKTTPILMVSNLQVISRMTFKDTKKIKWEDPPGTEIIRDKYPKRGLYNSFVLWFFLVFGHGFWEGALLATRRYASFWVFTKGGRNCRDPRAK